MNKVSFRMLKFIKWEGKLINQEYKNKDKNKFQNRLFINFSPLIMISSLKGEKKIRL